MSSTCFLLTIVIIFTHIRNLYYRESGRGERGREGERGRQGVREGESERGRENLILPNELLLTPNYLPCPMPNPQFPILYFKEISSQYVQSFLSNLCISTNSEWCFIPFLRSASSIYHFTS